MWRTSDESFQRCPPNYSECCGSPAATWPPAPFDAPTKRRSRSTVPARPSAGPEELLTTLDIDAHIKGFAADVPALYVANHRSYVDILGVLSVAPVRFVAKAELKDWPVIGAATALGDSIFIDRADRAPRNAPEARIAAALSAGKSVCVFPEGTTHASAWASWPGGVRGRREGRASPSYPIADQSSRPQPRVGGRRRLRESFHPHLCSGNAASGPQRWRALNGSPANVRAAATRSFAST